MRGKILPAVLKLFAVIVLVGFVAVLNAGGAEFENPCGKPAAAAQGEQFIGKYIDNKWNTHSVVSDARAIMAMLKEKKYDDKAKISSFLDMSMYDWACKNGYTIKNTNTGFYFFNKDEKQNRGVFVGIRPDGYLHSEGVRNGWAKFELDTRGRSMETYYLQVIISKLKPAPNEKPTTTADESAQIILNAILDHANLWAQEYYGAIIKKAGAK